MPKKKNPSGGGGLEGKRSEFFKAIKNEKLDTVRWGLRNGGVGGMTQDPDSGLCCVAMAAALGKSRSLACLLEYFARQQFQKGHKNRQGAPEELDVRDDDGRTALMMAAAKDNRECVELLYKAGASATVKCERGLTAVNYAEKAGHKGLVAWFARGGESSEEEDDPDEEPWLEGETATQRSKRLKRERDERESRTFGKQEEERAKVRAEAEGRELKEAVADYAEEQRKASAPEPLWPEVQVLKVAKGSKKEDGREISVTRDSVGDPLIDPALWWALQLNRLQLQLAGLCELPAELGRLVNIETLVLNGNGLTSLPACIGKLTKLKTLELENNQISEVPPRAVWKKLSGLKVVNVANNQIDDDALDSMSAAFGTNLSSLNVSNNKLTFLPIDCDTLGHLNILSAADNELEELPDEIGELSQLHTLILTNNKLTELPGDMGQLTEKKVKMLNMDGNNFKDKKIPQILRKEKLPAKMLFMHLRKQNGKGKKGGGKSKKAAKAAAAKEARDAAEAKAAAAAAAAAAESSSEEETGSEYETDSEEEEEGDEPSRFNRPGEVAHDSEEEKEQEEDSEAKAKAAAEAAELAAYIKAAEQDAIDQEKERRRDARRKEREALQAKMAEKQVGVEARQAAIAEHKAKVAAKRAANAEKAEDDREKRNTMSKEDLDAEQAQVDARAEIDQARRELAKMSLEADKMLNLEKQEQMEMERAKKEEKGQAKKAQPNRQQKGGVQRKKVGGAHGTTAELPPGVVLCQAYNVGLVIGPKGSTIKKIQNKSGARIDIGKTPNKQGQVVIQCSGNAEAMKSAVMQLQSVLRNARK